MTAFKPKKDAAAWLLTADRYMAEIAEAERVEALAAAAKRLEAGRARARAFSRPWLVLSSSPAALAQGGTGREGPEPVPLLR
jgi:hypothetical protein